MTIYKPNNKPTIKKINEYDQEYGVYYRFQFEDWEMGTKSWGMIYSTEEEAREAYKEDGLDPDDAILNGKSCCSTFKELTNHDFSFGEGFVVLILSGDYVEEGHDGEDVVDVDQILEIWSWEDYEKICTELYA